MRNPSFGAFRKYLPESIRQLGRKLLSRIEEERRRSVERQLDSEVLRSRSRGRSERQVVFVSDIPRSREAKLAYGMREQGWEVFLLHREKPTFDPNRYFSEALSYSTPTEALRLSLGYSPVAYHVFSCWNFEVAAMMIRKRPGKVVFDDYDVLTGMIRKRFLDSKYPGQSEKEIYCLENADGLCCRGLEVQHLKRELGLKPGGETIFFADYCWDREDLTNETPQVIRSEGGRAEALSVVFCGGVMPKPSENLGSDGDLLSVGKALVEGGVEFHLYPSFAPRGMNFTEYFREYIEAGEQLAGFHIHHPLPADELIQSMASHTAGIHLAGMNINQSYDNESGEPIRRKYASTNKIFDYLDSGLPIVICDARLQRWLACRYGSGKWATEELLRNPREFLADILKYRVRVTEARRAYGVRRQAVRLAEFYKKLSSGHPVSSPKETALCNV